MIEAVEYFNPDDSQTQENLKHIFFVRPQVFMFTPEEVYSHSTTAVDWSRYEGAAIVDLGKSAWFDSFEPRHLSQCSHYQAMFYDEFLDIICEGVESRAGAYFDKPPLKQPKIISAQIEE